MNIVKLYEGKSPKPLFARLDRICTDSDHRFYGGLLIIYPLDVPERKRTARWVMPNEVHVEWVRPFKENNEPTT